MKERLQVYSVINTPKQLILKCLRDAPHSLSEIKKMLPSGYGATISTINYHLKFLMENNLVARKLELIPLKSKKYKDFNQHYLYHLTALGYNALDFFTFQDGKPVFGRDYR